MKIIILNETLIRHCVKLDLDTVAAIEQAFVSLSSGKAATHIMSIPVPQYNGEMHIKSAVIKDFDGFAIKIASGFFDNPGKGLPSGSGMMVLFNAQTGFPVAVLLDNGYLTHLRTGAAGAAAARHFAKNEIAGVGMIGAGRQGREQIRSLKLVRDFKRVKVYDKDQKAMNQYVVEMSDELGIPVTPATSVMQVVEESDLLVTATPSKVPFVKADWLHPGLHITAIGADNGHKQELFPDVLASPNRRFCDLRSQVERLGEHRFALEAGTITKDDPIDEIGEVIAGLKPGRTSDDEITICDLTGVGVQDTAIAWIAYKNAQKLGLGLEIDSQSESLI